MAISRQILTAISAHRPGPATAVDSATISRAKLGDIHAFTTIVESYYSRCLRFARGVLHNPDDAEDMVQETFVRLYRALPRYEERQRFESWLFHILGNCCRTANKSVRRREAMHVDDDKALERLPSPDVTGARLDREWGKE